VHSEVEDLRVCAVLYDCQREEDDWDSEENQVEACKRMDPMQETTKYAGWEWGCCYRED
jgi:hypothetical protein